MGRPWQGAVRPKGRPRRTTDAGGESPSFGERTRPSSPPQRILTVQSVGYHTFQDGRPEPLRLPVPAPAPHLVGAARPGEARRRHPSSDAPATRTSPRSAACSPGALHPRPSLSWTPPPRPAATRRPPDNLRWACNRLRAEATGHRAPCVFRELFTTNLLTRAREE